MLPTVIAATAPDYSGGIYQVYSSVDTMTMFLYKPMVKYLIIPWAKPMVCWICLNFILDNLSMTPSLSNSFDVCQ